MCIEAYNSKVVPDESPGLKFFSPIQNIRNNPRCR